MNDRQPPRVATWLLERLGSGTQREALLGDLAERYRRGHSIGWYRWQVAAAITAGAVQDARDHAVLTVRAIVLWYLLAAFTTTLTFASYSSVGIWFWNWTITHDSDLARVLWFGRPQWTSPPLLLMSCLNAALVGGVIARVHRGHAAATLFSCAAVNVVTLLIMRWWAPGVSFWPVLLAPTPPYYATVPTLVTLIGVPMSLMLGGLIGTRPGDDERQPVSGAV